MHFLWRDCRLEYFFAAGRLSKPAGLRVCTRFRPLFRLIASPFSVQFRPFPDISIRVDHVATAIHRYEESIGGRPYLIEVSAISLDRWRACIVRTPGVPTALMPFYGGTPEEAARNLTEWLARAHRRVPNNAGSV